MVSIEKLRKQVAEERARRAVYLAVQKKKEEKKKLKRELFELKHGKKIKFLKKVGRNIAKSQRKSPTKRKKRRQYSGGILDLFD